MRVPNSIPSFSFFALLSKSPRPRQMVRKRGGEKFVLACGCLECASLSSSFPACVPLGAANKERERERWAPKKEIGVERRGRG